MAFSKYLFLFLFNGICLTSLAQSPARNKEVQNFVEQSYGKLFSLYQKLHATTELSFQEKNTAATMAAQLKAAGFTVTENVGGYGVVGILKNGVGPTVLVRTDLDGLPLREETNLPYASKATGKADDGKEVPVMHACGHDMHMTVFTGVAQTLAKFKNIWQGTVVFIGQPAEERSGGAKAMLKAGLFTKFPQPDYCLALHNNASLPAGKVGYTEGNIMANVDAVEISVRGLGGHGAMPQNTKDPVVLASQIVLALQTIVSRETSPLQPSVVTVGSIHGGTTYNIIPDEVKLQLTLRSYSDEVRNNTIASIKRICKGLAEGAGIPQDRLPVVTVRDQFNPFTYNNPELTKKLAQSFKKVLGDENVVDTPPSMVGEDFAFYGRTEAKIPICLYWLGTVDPKKLAESQKSGQTLPTLHSSNFAPVPEPTIKTGIKTMSAAVMDLLAPKK